MNYDTLSKEDLIELLKKSNGENHLLLKSLTELKYENNNLLKTTSELKYENSTLSKTADNLKYEMTIVKTEYNSVIIELRDLNIKYNSLLIDYNNKNEKIKRDIYNQFVKKFEKAPKESLLINEAEHNTDKKTPGRKQGGKNFTDNLVPTRSIILKPDEVIQANSNEVFIKIGEDKTIKIVKIPSSYEVVEIINEKYRLNDRSDNKIYQKLKNDPFGNSPVTPTVVADIIKFEI